MGQIHFHGGGPPEIGFRECRPARYTACLATFPRHCLVYPVNISPPDWAKSVLSLAFRITPKQLAQSARKPRIMNAGKQGNKERQIGRIEVTLQDDDRK
jgi:hypothetical protein